MIGTTFVSAERRCMKSTSFEMSCTIFKLVACELRIEMSILTRAQQVEHNIYLHAAIPSDEP
jgi:hypothetical protein